VDLTFLLIDRTLFQWQEVHQYGILDFGIKLEKNTYEAGETAKGSLIIEADKSFKVRKLKFSVCGKERYEAEMSGEWGHSSEEHDIFFFEDLIPQLKPTFDFSQADEDSKIEIHRGSYAIPFHFPIPSNALESYRGKHARITYEVEVGADMDRWKRDYHHTISFVVINPKMAYKLGDRYYLGEKPEKKEGVPYLDMEFEKKNTGVDELPKFSPGEIISGRLKMENIALTRVRKAIIEIYSVEYARWGHPRTVSDNHKKQIAYDQSKDKDTIAFEIQIPDSAKRSFNAKRSENNWLLEAKVDISDSPDICARVIQVASGH
jgi:hypothetical protein